MHVDDLVCIPFTSIPSPLSPPDHRSHAHFVPKSRNFALNPKEGIKIRAFKHAASQEARQDTELFKLAAYLVHVGQAPDLRIFSHKVRCVYSVPAATPVNGQCGLTRGVQDWKVTAKRLRTRS